MYQLLERCVIHEVSVTMPSNGPSPAIEQEGSTLLLDVSVFWVALHPMPLCVECKRPEEGSRPVRPDSALVQAGGLVNRKRRVGREDHSIAFNQHSLCEGPKTLDAARSDKHHTGTERSKLGDSWSEIQEKMRAARARKVAEEHQQRRMIFEE
jgi:hypothetical protein